MKTEYSLVAAIKLIKLEKIEIKRKWNMHMIFITIVRSATIKQF